jgi:hemerythrin-like metal-binding protein
MDQAAYPQSGPHKAEHRSLLTQLGTAKEEYASGALGAVDLCTYLADWLIDHIAKSDKLLADHLKAHKP